MYSILARSYLTVMELDILSETNNSSNAPQLIMECCCFLKQFKK